MQAIKEQTFQFHWSGSCRFFSLPTQKLESNDEKNLTSVTITSQQEESGVRVSRFLPLAIARRRATTACGNELIEHAAATAAAG